MVGTWRVVDVGALKIPVSMEGICPIQLDQGYKLISSWFEFIKPGSLTGEPVPQICTAVICCIFIQVSEHAQPPVSTQGLLPKSALF